MAEPLKPFNFRMTEGARRQLEKDAETLKAESSADLVRTAIAEYRRNHILRQITVNFKGEPAELTISEAKALLTELTTKLIF